MRKLQKSQGAQEAGSEVQEGSNPILKDLNGIDSQVRTPLPNGRKSDSEVKVS